MPEMGGVRVLHKLVNWLINSIRVLSDSYVRETRYVKSKYTTTSGSFFVVYFFDFGIYPE